MNGERLQTWQTPVRNAPENIARLKICILASQYFDWGVYGGFGSMARKLAESLALAGHEVSVIVPRRAGQAPFEMIGGVMVGSFSPRNIREACRLIRSNPADVFHSQDPTLLTFLAQKLRPRKIHLVTCRDPRDAGDWWNEFHYATPMRRLRMPFHYVTESGPLVRHAVRNADRVFVPAHFLREKAARVFGLERLPEFLPNLIDVPTAPSAKKGTPTMAFVARWDRRKRPWIFFELAKDFPEYRFIAVGKGSASAESSFDASLRKKYGLIPNLEMTGFIDRFREPERMTRIFEESLIFVNTASREGLPLTFLEAGAQGCAILSGVDPDGFATKFGRHVPHDDFKDGLAKLLGDSARERGQEAHRYVRNTYECSAALAAHIREYDDAIRARS